MLIKFLKYIHAEDVKTRDELWELYKIWMGKGKPVVRRPVVTDTRIKHFIETMCVVAADQQVDKSRLHDMYMIFSEDVRGGSIFARELRAVLGDKIADFRPSAQVAGKRPRGWKGIGLKP